MQLIPARGRKLAVIGLLVELLESCNLSPRGDGNGTMRFQTKQSKQLQLIPARGRKRARVGGQFLLDMLKLIPARGRKQQVALFRHAQICVETYPREGTETQAFRALPWGTTCCNLSPRGDKNLLSSKDKIGYNEATGILPKRHNAYTDLCADFLYLPC